MDPERWRLVDRIFESALALPAEQRAALLARECDGDDELRREVESLLAHDGGDDSLEAGAAREAASLLLRAATSREGLVGRTLDRFEVEAPLGSGGMGEVYRARDPRLGRLVALKLIPAHLSAEPERRRRFRREALATSALNHPNIVTVYEILELAERDVLVTELVDGVTLEEHASAGLPPATALGIGIQIARALAAAHAVGVVHRDVKPQNVMVRRDGLVKLLDFGIAKSLSAATSENETRPGNVLGTVTYMSPEQARGLPVDARTDVWSLGVTLYQMLTGEAPFRGSSPTDTIAAILLQEPVPPSQRRAGLPPELDRVIARALAKDREERYADGAALTAHLERALETMDDPTAIAGAPRSPARTATPSSTTSPRSKIAVASLAAIALVTALAVYLLAGAGDSIDSLAVLPLVDTSGDPQYEYLSDGLAESLIQSLGQAGDLKVMSRAASFRYQGREAETRTIARELGVRGILSGRITPRPDGVAVSLELTDTRDDSHVWGSQYDVRTADLASLHVRVTRDLRGRLDRGLTSEQEAGVARLHTNDAEAYQLYLQGRYYWYKTLPEAFHRSRDFFLRAIEIDPDYALAWAGLGHYYGFGAASGLLAPDEYWPRTELAAKRVQELDPRLPEAAPLHAALTLYWRRDWVAGEEELRSATAVFPEALNHHAFVLAVIGRLEEALHLRELDIERDPRSGRSRRSLGQSLYLARRYEDAATHLRLALELDDADLQAWQLLGDTLAALRQESEAVAAWRWALDLAGNDELADLLVRTYQVDGIDAALAAVARVRAATIETARERGSYVPAYEIARLHLRAGDRQRALAWAVRAFDERNRLALDMLSDPVFDPLRDDPRFREAVASLDLPEEWTDAIARTIGRPPGRPAVIRQAAP